MIPYLKDQKMNTTYEFIAMRGIFLFLNEYVKGEWYT